MPRTNITKPIDAEKYARGSSATGLAAGKSAVERAGGIRGAGLIRGAAVITRGEALGHGMWIDKDMLSQVRRAISAAGSKGIKARFTHPGLSSDGLGSFLGRFVGGVEDGDIVRADLHFSESAHTTPDGDLAAYVMNLAEQDPEAFGTSIVFQRDLAAEMQFESKHTKPFEYVDEQGQKQTGKRFVSPDSAKVNNYRHARLKVLRAIDAVDSPAANPGGMFHAQAIGPEAEALLAYSLGLSTERPQLTNFSIDPDRVSGFVSRFLDRHNLAITNQEQHAMPKSTNQQPPAEVKNSEAKSFTADELQKYVSAFGESGAKWLLEGKSFAECEALHKDQQHADALAAKEKALADNQAALAAKEKELADAAQERDALKAKIAALGTQGEKEGVSFDAEGKNDKPAKALSAKVGNRLSAYAASFKMPGQN